MIKLEPFDRNDFQRLIEWIDNEDILIQFAGPIFSFPLTIMQLEEYKNDKQRLTYRVIDQSNEEIIGHAELYIPENNETTKICRILIGEEKNRGRGFGQQIINELLKITFLNLQKVSAELNVYNWNINAIKCYEKIGFVVNPDKTTKAEVKGNTWIALNMVINKEDWENIRQPEQI